MRVALNGEPVDVAQDSSVAEVVARLGFSSKERGVAVALDGEVVPRREWAEVYVRAGAHIEVLTAVQGG